MRDRSNFFFIHIKKNMGTTIMKQLPKNYLNRYYGVKTKNEWEELNGEKINKVNHLPWVNDDNIKKSIDHLSLDNLVNLGILDDWDITNRKFLGIIRDPIEWFISDCNYSGRNPEKEINFIKNSNYTQRNAFKSSNKIDLTLILMSEKEKIINWFGNFGLNMDLDTKLNVSNKKYTINDISPEQMRIIKNILNYDFMLYESLKKSSGILNYVGITQI